MQGKGGGCGVSANEYSCTHWGQINCGDLTPYLTYICWYPLSIFLQVKVCLPLTAATFCSSCYCWKLFSKFLFSDFFVHLPRAACTPLPIFLLLLGSLRYLIFLIPILLALLPIFLPLYWYNCIYSFIHLLQWYTADTYNPDIPATVDAFTLKSIA